ncbi:hypothetical protein GCM10023170_077900 [Phytohabitans houttuyneae]|uniref:DNA-binding protein n=1 Tax=Phytohabitans houttuyneae TaxID=1076126 RepID=A0A6V8KNK1_9ACTN|nr:hypothetical protein Phou_091500 [Phytohabitans houttuyneae]
MGLHRFGLILDRPPDRSQAASVVDTHPDLDVRPSRQMVTARRRSPSMAAAVVSAIVDLEAFDLHPARVCADDWVTLADIGERIGRSREMVRQWSTGQQGPGGFPPPVNPGRDTKFYSWTEVALWLRAHRDFYLPRPDGLLVVANLLLQAKRLAPLVRDKQTLTGLLSPYQPGHGVQPPRAREGLTTR